MRYIDAGIDDEEPLKKRPFLFGVFCGLMVGLAVGLYLGFLWYAAVFSSPSEPVIPRAYGQLQFQWPWEQPQQQDMLTYEDKLFGMKINYPKDWVTQDKEEGV
jgi:hypothetical protein